MLTTLLAFAVTILIIVAIHEYGHYLTMRLFGVRVLTFSVGFGPRLLSWRSKSGTDFVISAIPLGGYVKPLDRRDCEVQPGEESQEFSGKPAWQRIIVYAAGPAANLILAVLIYWLVLMGGQSGVPPVIGAVQDGSPAATAGLRPGDELVRLDGRTVQTWEQFGMAMLRHVGERGEVPLTVRGDDSVERTVALSLAAWSVDPEQALLPVIGVSPRPLPAELGEITAGSPAELAGLRKGDRILRVNGEPVSGWSQWVESVQRAPGQPLAIAAHRDGATLNVTLVPESIVNADGEAVGRAGVRLGGLREIHYSPLEAIPAAVSRMTQQIGMIFVAVGRMLTGELSVKTLGGPITIAQAAGETAAIGVATFLMFLAFFSISLGVINLLPIPMLDGGWIVFGLVEMIRGKALPERFLMVAQSVGMMLVLGLMCVAVFNDLMRQFA